MEVALGDDALSFWKGMTWVLLAYFCAFGAALVVGAVMPFDDPLWIAVVADLVATAMIFGFSLGLRNASVYDPYWSVVPIAIVGFWALSAAEANGLHARQVILVGTMAFWGTRLTTNWAQGWAGLDHEDWRYVQLRRQSGVFYPLVNLLGIHYMPTILVLLALWPAWQAVRATTPLNVLDITALLVAFGATLIEAAADGQLRAFRARNQRPDAFIDEGLWRWSRHPNYLGEILFWWAIWLFAVAADPANALTCVGALALVLLFRFVSIPLMEKRLLARRPGYARQIARVPMLLPWFPKRGDADLPAAVVTEDPPSSGDALADENVRLALDTLPVVPPPEPED